MTRIFFATVIDICRLSCVVGLISFLGHNHAAATAAIASAHPLATSAGHAIFEQGGNAFDAAVAVSAVLAVVEPYASGLGGGGFWLLHEAKSSRDIMIDGREVAPARATENMFLDGAGQPVPGKSLNGALAAGIPGTPAALTHLTQNYGRLTLAQNLAPAIKLARDGFKVDSRLAQSLSFHEKKLAQYTETAEIFLPNGKPPVAGQVLRQPYLAATLTALAESGNNGFYRGPVAGELTRSVNAAGGLWDESDLQNYSIVERKPVRFNYRNATITTASLPSAGGLTLAQALNMLEQLAYDEADPKNQAHLIAEVLRLTYKDRVELLGDSDFVQVPVKRLLSRNYARKQALLVDPKHAGNSLHKQPAEHGGSETTHFSIIDSDDNRVAATMSTTTFFGSGFVAGKTGVLLNNEMDDFSMGALIPNIFGLYGSRANMIAPGKRPLSSMSPTFVENDTGILILGTPGGSRIISMILLVILDYVNNEQLDPQKLVAIPRFHHQYLPDYIQVEPDSFAPDWIDALRSKGHEVREMQRKWGNMQLILFDNKTQQSIVANDPRGITDTRY